MTTRLNTLFILLMTSLLAGSAAAQNYTTITPPSNNPGASSAAFGAAMAATSKRLYVAAPNFSREGVPTTGWVFAYDAKTFEPLFRLFTGIYEEAMAGASLAATAGKRDLLIGYPGFSVPSGNESNFGAGSVAYYHEVSGFTLRINNPEPAEGDDFGRALGMNKKSLVVGAPLDEDGQLSQKSGSAFIAAKKDFNLSRLPVPSYNDGDEVGAAIAANEKFIAVGAPGTASQSGAVHVYDARTAAYLTTLTPDSNNGEPKRFGQALAFQNNILWVGAPLQDFADPLSPSFAPEAGAIYGFNVLNFTGPAIRIISNSFQSGARFGQELSADRRRLTVSSPNYAPNISSSGLVEVFDFKSVPQSFLSPLGFNGEEFGAAVQLLPKNRIAIGAPNPASMSSNGNVFISTLPK